MKKKLFFIILVLLIFLVLIHYFTYIYYQTPARINERFHYDSLAVEMGIFSEFGISLDSFEVFRGKVKANENLSAILSDYNFSATQTDQLVKQSEGIFDVRKIRTGNKYTIFCIKDNKKTPKYFVYETSPVEYYVFSLFDSMKVVREERQIKIIKTAVSGKITSSLWNSMIDKGIDPMLAMNLSEIYAWSIDFFGIQKNDYYKVIFDAQYVDTTYLGLGKIYGAVFNHMGKDYFAIPFFDEGKENYFDNEGNSLRKAFLKAPLQFSRISSRFSYSRLHPVLKIRRPHFGVDYAAPIGTPVHSIGDGKVTQAGHSGGAGRMIKIKHNSIYSTAYLHLSSFASGIRAGVHVNQGDVIGYVGSSGLSTGPHLDFRFYKYDKPVDPLKVEAPSEKPVSKHNMNSFLKIKNEIVGQLNKITL